MAEKRRPDRNRTLSERSIRWRNLFDQTFDKLVQDELSRKPLSDDAPLEDFQAATLRAVFFALRDSGMSVDEIVGGIGELIADERRGPSEWTAAMNDSRVELIEKKFSGGLDLHESIELAGLTRKMRRRLDTEKHFPMEGARQLYEKLLNDASGSPP